MPGTGHEPIVCRLRGVKINANTSYEALSYTWGDSSDRRTITVNKTTFEVTYNLEEALRTLRLPGQRRKLWVDAICINQKDLSEKAEQIPIMGQIYRNAHRVLVWLGEGTKETDFAIDTIKARLSNRGELDVAAFASRSDHEAWLCCGFGLKDLMFRPWWTRVWVLQEIAMSAGDPLLVCGNKSLPWSSLVNFIEQLSGDQCRFFQSTERRVHILEMMEMRIRAQRPPSMRDYSVNRDDTALVEDDIAWISRTWMFESSDPRDKIYALLGLTRGPVGRKIKIDYSIAVSKVMRNLVRQQIDDQRLDFLTLCSPEDSEATPTWLPVLGTHKFPVLPTVRTSSPSLDPFSRDLNMASGRLRSPTCSVDWPAAVLFCNGMCIGSVVDKYLGMFRFSTDREKAWACILELSSLQSLHAYWAWCCLKSFQPARDPKLQTYLHHLKKTLDDHDLDVVGMSLDEKAHKVKRYKAAIETLLKWTELELWNVPTASSDFWQPLQSRLNETALLEEGRADFMTDTGLIGLGPVDLEEGDQVVLFHASSFAYVLRSTDLGRHRLIGQALVCPPSPLLIPEVGQQCGDARDEEPRMVNAQEFKG